MYTGNNKRLGCHGRSGLDFGSPSKKGKNHCFRPMRCFPKFFSWDCFVRLHYEVIVFYWRNFSVNVLDRFLCYVTSLGVKICACDVTIVFTVVWCEFLQVV